VAGPPPGRGSWAKRRKGDFRSPGGEYGREGESPYFFGRREGQGDKEGRLM